MSPLLPEWQHRSGSARQPCGGEMSNAHIGDGPLGVELETSQSPLKGMDAGGERVLLPDEWVWPLVCESKKKNTRPSGLHLADE